MKHRSIRTLHYRFNFTFQFPGSEKNNLGGALGSTACLNCRVKFSMLIISMCLSVICVAQSTAPKHKNCDPILQFDWVQYEGTSDRTEDSFTVCSDGNLTAFHAFRAPRVGDSPSEPTKWEYTDSLSGEELSLVRRVLSRQDVKELMGKERTQLAHFPNGNVNGFLTVKAVEPVFTVYVTDHLELATFRKVSTSARDVVCLFNHLFYRAKDGRKFEADGMCDSLKDMAARQVASKY